MLATSETALICDFAETYHVLDWRALPVRTAAALAAGLRDDARIWMKLTGQRLSMRDTIAAATLDRLSFLAWAKTKDGMNNRNRPQSVLKILTEEREEQPDGFDTAEELMEMRRRIMESDQ